MAHCHHCGNVVSTRFALVFADGDGRVLACPACAAAAGIGETIKRRRAAAA